MRFLIGTWTRHVSGPPCSLSSSVALALSLEGGLDLLCVPCGCDCRPKVELGAVRRKPLQRKDSTEMARRLDSEGDGPRAIGCSMKK